MPITFDNLATRYQSSPEIQSLVITGGLTSLSYSLCVALSRHLLGVTPRFSRAQVCLIALGSGLLIAHSSLEKWDPHGGELKVRPAFDSLTNRDVIRITVTPNKITQDPGGVIGQILPLLDEFSGKNSDGPLLMVNFCWKGKGGEVHKGVEQDAGGPSREFLCRAAMSLRDKLSGATTTELYKPTGSLDSDRLTLLEHWGRLLTYCYSFRPPKLPRELTTNLDRSYLTGIYLDPAVLEIAFSMTGKEVETEIDQLPLTTKARLYQMTVEKFLAKETACDKSLAYIGYGETRAADHLEGLDETRDPKRSAQQQLFDFLEENLKRHKVEERLRECQALARGLKRGCDALPRNELSWDNIRKGGALPFSNKAQGVIDRAQIALQIRSAHSPSPEWGSLFNPLQTHADHLAGRVKAWIRSDKTPIELVRLFFQQITGATAVTSGQTIKIGLRAPEDPHRTLKDDEDPEALALEATYSRFDSCSSQILFPLEHVKTMSEQQFFDYLSEQVRCFGGFSRA
ncbi:MAG: hypothetical protein AB7F31_04045 [Parachlamydiales bacterium]